MFIYNKYIDSNALNIIKNNTFTNKIELANLLSSSIQTKIKSLLSQKLDGLKNNCIFNVKNNNLFYLKTLSLDEQTLLKESIYNLKTNDNLSLSLKKHSIININTTNSNNIKNNNQNYDLNNSFSEIERCYHNYANSNKNNIIKNKITDSSKSLKNNLNVLSMNFSKINKNRKYSLLSNIHNFIQLNGNKKKSIPIMLDNGNNYPYIELKKSILNINLFKIKKLNKSLLEMSKDEKKLDKIKNNFSYINKIIKQYIDIDIDNKTNVYSKNNCKSMDLNK